jgi:hypothetical protein
MSGYPPVVVVEEPPKCPVAPQALNAAWRAELLAPPPPAPPAGGVPVWLVDVPVGKWAGAVTPCFFRQDASAVRLAAETPVAEDAAGVDVVVEVVDELLPHAAMARVAVSAASTGMSRRARGGLFLMGIMWILSWWC